MKPGATTPVASYNGTEISFEHSDGKWRRVDDGRYASTPNGYTAQMEAVLVGEAAARTLNEGLVQPEDVGLLIEFINAMASRVDSFDFDTSEAGLVDLGIEVPAGTHPVAWQAVALHTIYHAVRDADAAWPDWEGDDIPPLPQSDLIDARFYDNDLVLLRAAQENPEDNWPPPESCIEQAIFRVCAAEHALMPHPLNLLPIEAGITCSPKKVAEQTGFGSRIGGGLGAAARLYEALPDDIWYSPTTGLEVMSQAHRTVPGSPEFEQWLHDNRLLPLTGDEEPAADPNETHRVIWGLMDVCLHDKDDSTRALDIMEHIARIDPQAFESGVAEFRSVLAADESEDDIYEALARRPRLEALASAPPRHSTTASGAPR